VGNLCPLSRDCLQGAEKSTAPFDRVDLLLQLRDPRELHLECAAVLLDLGGEIAARRVKLATKFVDDLAAFIQQRDHAVELGARDRPSSVLASGRYPANTFHARGAFPRHGVVACENSTARHFTVELPAPDALKVKNRASQPNWGRACDQGPYERPTSSLTSACQNGCPKAYRPSTAAATAPAFSDSTPSGDQ
jgi:hypothetical protein